MIGRRQFIHGVSCAVASSLFGCSSGSGLGGLALGGDSGGDGTGIRGLNLPDEILARPNVSDVVGVMKDAGIPLHLSRGPNPPRIEGKYSISGLTYFPAVNKLNPGNFDIWDQTPSNRIKTGYSQFFGEEVTQSGTSSLGEIIRGDDWRLFTTYSIMNIQDTHSGCSFRTVFVLDGKREENGDLSAYYFGVPTDLSQNNPCFMLGMGEMYLSRKSGLKRIVEGTDLFSGSNGRMISIPKEIQRIYKE